MISHNVYNKSYNPETNTFIGELKGVEKEIKLQSIYGYGYHPHGDVETVVTQHGYDYESCSGMVDTPYQIIPLAEGEIVVFNPITQSSVHFSNTGGIIVNTTADLQVTAASVINIVSTGNITITAPLVQINGVLAVSGAISSSGGNVSDSVGSLDSLRTTYNAHRHTETDSITSTPI